MSEMNELAFASAILSSDNAQKIKSLESKMKYRKTKNQLAFIFLAGVILAQSIRLQNIENLLKTETEEKE